MGRRQKKARHEVEQDTVAVCGKANTVDVDKSPLTKMLSGNTTNASFVSKPATDQQPVSMPFGMMPANYFPFHQNFPSATTDEKNNQHPLFINSQRSSWQPMFMPSFGQFPFQNFSPFFPAQLQPVDMHSMHSATLSFSGTDPHSLCCHQCEANEEKESICPREPNDQTKKVESVCLGKQTNQKETTDTESACPQKPNEKKKVESACLRQSNDKNLHVAQMFEHCFDSTDFTDKISSGAVNIVKNEDFSGNNSSIVYTNANLTEDTQPRALRSGRVLSAFPKAHSNHKTRKVKNRVVINKASVDVAGVPDSGDEGSTENGMPNAVTQYLDAVVHNSDKTNTKLSELQNVSIRLSIKECNKKLSDSDCSALSKKKKNAKMKVGKKRHLQDDSCTPEDLEMSCGVLESSDLKTGLDVDLQLSNICEESGNDLMNEGFLFSDGHFEESNMVIDMMSEEPLGIEGMECIIDEETSSLKNSIDASSEANCESETTEKKVDSNKKLRKICKSAACKQRGVGGWEESLRQHPKRVQYFQIKKKGCKKKMKGTGGKSVNELLESESCELDELVPQEICESPTVAVTFPQEEVTPIVEDLRHVKVEPLKEQEPLTDQEVGLLVWAKLGRERWWPGITIAAEMARVKPDCSMKWVFWFGDHKISKVSEAKMVPFVSAYQEKLGKKILSAIFKRGLLEAITECAVRANTAIDFEDRQALLQWAEKGFVMENRLSTDDDPFPPKREKPVPDMVLEYLQVMQESEVRVECQRNVRKESESAIAEVKNGIRTIQDVCIGCDDISCSITHQHPMFEGGLCKACKDNLTESLFAFGEDGTGVYCSVCSGGGNLFVCHSGDCNRAYCTMCVEVYLGSVGLKQILSKDPWLCFLCAPYTKATHGYLKPKLDWQNNLVIFFDTGYRVGEPDLSYLTPERRSPIRVLSLFDGIGTGKLVLDELGIETGVFYSSEINEDAILVTSVHHGTSVQQIGDITKLDQSQLRNLCPIDLIIGGSPCNDFSLVNHARKGFGGTGILFFDYHRVLKTIQRFSPDRHVFWLYENVASMKSEYKKVISRFLECDPAMWDAKYFTAQRRVRYFWGNIPGMYSTPVTSQLETSVSLGSSLVQNCNRKPLVERLHCVRSGSRSLLQGKNEDMLPVSMNGKEDGIWISELESIFGFPAHYTDVGNLPQTRRQGLLARAWSVPVIKHLLSPLCRYFKHSKINNAKSVRA